MIYNLSSTTQKNLKKKTKIKTKTKTKPKKNSFQAATSKLKKFQGLFKE